MFNYLSLCTPIKWSRTGDYSLACTATDVLAVTGIEHRGAFGLTLHNLTVGQTYPEFTALRVCLYT